MSINIKEIFQSDNLSVSQDKINYNFDQILANGGGPQGLKGDKGTTGAIGSIGPKGDVGPKGAPGSVGATGADGYFTLESYTSPIDQHTLLPKTQPTSGSTVGERPTNLVLGRTDSSYTENSIDKLTLLTLVDENDGQNFTDIIRFRLSNLAGTYKTGSGSVRITPVGVSGLRLKIGTLGPDDILELQSKETILSDDTNAIKIKITSSLIDVNGPVNFAGGIVTINTTGSLVNQGNSSLLGNNTIGATGKTNTITGTSTITGAEFRINTTGSLPAGNKILVAQDGNGKALWKNPTEVMGIYPIGTIVFVNPADISTTYFNLTSYTFNNGSISYQFFGRGKENTRWGGWYLVMGQTNKWVSGSTEIYVPTNIPGSILMGASAPDNSDLPGSVVLNDAFKSSMGTQGYNPPVGYGTSYQPSLRGAYTGVGSQGVVGPGSPSNPGDLLTRIIPGVFSSGAPYDYLDDSPILDGAIAMLDANTNVYNNPTFHALPMAIYLGSVNFYYAYTSNSF